MIFLNFDFGPILNLKKEFESQVRNVMSNEIRALAIQTHSHILEEVQAKLHSTRQKYIENLHFEEVSADTWVISLGQKAMWIEEGIKPNTSMLDGLLKSPKAKTSKDGSRYIVVPFEHKKGPTQQTPAAKTLTDTIKPEMKARKIPYGTIEKNADGSPKLGMLHSFNIMSQPLKTGPGPGQGRGPVGAVRQGHTGIPFLQGIRVFQSKVKNAKGEESVKRGITTFRVASSKHPEKWVHPGLEAKLFLDEAARWAKAEFETRIRDQVLISITKNF